MVLADITGSRAFSAQGSAGRLNGEEVDAAVAMDAPWVVGCQVVRDVTYSAKFSYLAVSRSTPADGGRGRLILPDFGAAGDRSGGATRGSSRRSVAVGVRSLLQVRLEVIFLTTVQRAAAVIIFFPLVESLSVGHEALRRRLPDASDSAPRAPAQAAPMSCRWAPTLARAALARGGGPQPINDRRRCVRVPDVVSAARRSRFWASAAGSGRLNRKP